MAAMETANPHRHGQQHQPYPALPASPTLTNPDMILPDYRSDSPDPDLNGHDRSPLMMWKNAHAATSATDLHQGQQHPDHPYGPTGPITPTTPIIYGNGTMLSDIGEVTEAESTPVKAAPTRLKGIHGGQRPSTRGSGSDTALRSSPTMGYEGVLKKRSKQSLAAAAAQRERRSSMESTSTITTTEKQDLFADFDDTVSVGDSVFQGDDEESMAESYTEGTPARESNARLGLPGADNTDRLSTYSMSSLSRKAEHILANAKKRLTTMEGNLTRARSSLHASSPSMSSIGSDGSTPSPPVKRVSTAIYTHESDLPSPTYSPRVSSDGPFPAPPAYRVTAQRSASSLGVSGGYRQPLSLSRSVDHLGNYDGQPIHPARISWHQRERALEPLGEDEVASTGETDRLSKGAKLDQFLSPTFGSFSDSGNTNERGPPRSVSVAQMRGIKDQVKDLKGKISNLREQARADSMKRRSLQSLRTPSPFTHAQVDQWYADPEPAPSSDAEEATKASSAINPWNGELSSVDGDEQAPESGPEKFTEDEDSIYGEVENETQLRPPENQAPQRTVAGPLTGTDVAEMEEGGDDPYDLQAEDGDVGREGQGDPEPLGEPAYESETESESGESLYHDTVQHPISHEDREDAFDYEHFFLHSAMGTISQQRLGRRGSQSSLSSEDSVETTRGPIVESNAAKEGSDKSTSPLSRSLKRRSSDASVSTVGTFATANDGSGESIREKEDTLRRVSGQFVNASTKDGPESVETVKNISFQPGGINADFRLPASRRSTSSITSVPEEGKENRPPQSHLNYSSHFRRPMSTSAAHSLHRPSVSSFESTGTTRSFPLVNKPKKSSSVGILTPHNASPDQELKTISDSLLNETASVYEQQKQDAAADRDGTKGHKANSSISGIVDALTSNPGGSEALQTLAREDQYLVERLVASLGRCVLGLTENGKASVENRMYRRRIDAARRILEGQDEAL